MARSDQTSREAGSRALLELDGLHVEYKSSSAVVQAVNGVSVAVQAGEFFTLLGPSGCGKTTTLRCVAGFETPTRGTIRIDDQVVVDAAKGVYLPVHRRDISMVFQSYAIWPHMTVGENILFPLDAGKVSRSEGMARARNALAMVGLESYFDRPATALSGGQQQRVALARAIVKNAKLLLLDEPLSNLDAKLRDQMRAELGALQGKLNTTTIYVTHDQEEALNLSDRIALMRDGRIIELGSPRDLYLRPKNLFTARFIGQAELLPCELGARSGTEMAVETPIGRVVAGSVPATQNSRATLMIRPEHIAFVDRASQGPNIFTGTVRGVSFLGRVLEYDVEINGGLRKVQAFSSSMFNEGDSVTVSLPIEHCVVIDERE
jgi:iron(III) transport system ATP-binding protein